jgi:hypothetical protein
VYDQTAAKEEVRKMIENNESLKGKTRGQMGLRPFRGTKIRSNLVNIAKLLGLDNEGETSWE